MGVEGRPGGVVIVDGRQVWWQTSGTTMGRLGVGAAARRARVLAAQRDPSVFVDGLLTDPRSGARFQAAAFQRDWHRRVEAERRLVLWAPIEHGKSARMIGHAIWWLGKNPAGHGLIVGESATSSQKLLAAIRRAIDEEPWVREVFPHLRPVRGRYAKWTDEQIRVEGIVMGDPHPSVQAVGPDGGILGARLDWVLGDDLCSFHTTATALQRQKVYDWWLSTVAGRLVEKSKVLILGNAWFPDDLMHRLAAKHGYASHKTEAFTETVDGKVDEASLLWPERFSRAVMQQRFEELGPVEGRRQLRCVAYASGSTLFDIGWFDAAFARGADEWTEAFGRPYGQGFLPAYHGPWPTYTGVDLAVSRKSKSDYTCIFTIAVNPETSRRYVVRVRRERMTGPQIIADLKQVYADFGGRIMVENNGAQDYLLQWMRESGVPVEAFGTGLNKADPRYGVQSLAQELASDMWALPTENELHQWRADCLSFPGEHTGDVLMASWFAREAARTAPIINGATIDPHDTRSAYSLRARYDLTSRRGLRRVS